MTVAPSAPSTRNRVLAVASRLPVTLGLLAVLLLVGVISRGLWHSFFRTAAFQWLAYGLPAFEAGRWWTPVTGTFLIARPADYLLAVVALWGIGYLEYRRGSRVAAAYFGVGQLFAVFGTALLVWVFAFTPWPWAHQASTMLDVGPSGGLFACMAAAVGLFAAPWRVRAWLLLLSTVFVMVLFWATIAKLDHLLAVLLVLAVDRSLRVQRTTLREQRIIAFVLMLVLGAVEVIVLLAPTNGLFGPTRPGTGSFWDVLTDILVIVIVADGLRRARRWAWVVSLILAAFNTITGVLLLALVLLGGWAEGADAIKGDPTLSLATAVMWLGMMIYLILVRRAFRWRRRGHLGAGPEATVDEVKALIHRYGGGNLSWMATWDANTYARTTTGLVAYQRRAGVAIALSDPLGPPEGRAQSVREFVDAAEHAGLIPCFFSASNATRAAAPAGWRELAVADDTIVDLPGLAYTGKRWNSVRTSLNRAEREEMTFRLTHLKDEPWGVQAQIRAISERWVGDRGLPEMGFTLGTLTEAEDPEVRLAIAVSVHGDVDGFLSWLPVYGADGAVRGWTLDLMRRRESGFGPVMEYLIAMSARAFQDEGAAFMSLSGAPLAHEYPPDAGMIADLSERLSDALEPVYGFQSLHRFKHKFHPRYETLYLLYRDEADLTRIGAGLTRAFLPDATLRQMAGAGIGLAPGR